MNKASTSFVDIAIRYPFSLVWLVEKFKLKDSPFERTPLRGIVHNGHEWAARKQRKWPFTDKGMLLLSDSLVSLIERELQ